MKHQKCLHENVLSRKNDCDLAPEFIAIIKAALDRKSVRILRIKGLCEKTGRAFSTIWRDVRMGVLPPQIPIGERAVGWRESEIDACIEARSLASRIGYCIDMRAFVRILVSASVVADSQAVDCADVGGDRSAGNQLGRNEP